MDLTNSIDVDYTKSKFELTHQEVIAKGEVFNLYFGSPVGKDYLEILFNISSKGLERYIGDMNSFLGDFINERTVPIVTCPAINYYLNESGIEHGYINPEELFEAYEKDGLLMAERIHIDTHISKLLNPKLTTVVHFLVNNVNEEQVIFHSSRGSMYKGMDLLEDYNSNGFTKPLAEHHYQEFFYDFLSSSEVKIKINKMAETYMQYSYEGNLFVHEYFNNYYFISYDYRTKVDQKTLTETEESYLDNKSDKFRS